MSSKEILNQHLTIHLDELQLQMQCEHDWEDTDWGYTCKKCKYHTDLWKELNDAIAQEKSSLFTVLGNILKPQ